MLECKCNICGEVYQVERAPTDEMAERCFNCWYRDLFDDVTSDSQDEQG